MLLQEAQNAIEAELRRPADGRRSSEDEVAAQLQTAAQVMLLHQVIYADTPGIGRSYDLMRRHRVYFHRLFESMGFELAFDADIQAIALVPGELNYGWKQTRLRKDETLVALVLRLLLEEATGHGEIDELGRAESDTDAFYDRYRTLAGEEPPSEARLGEILRAFQRRGFVRIGERDREEQVTPVTVLPGIRTVVTEGFAHAVVDWCERAARGEAGEGDVFAHIDAARQPALAVAPGSDPVAGAAPEGGDLLEDLREDQPHVPA